MMTMRFLKCIISLHFNRETPPPHRFFSGLALCVLLASLPSQARAEAPLLRLKAGTSSLTMNTGQKVVNEPLGSMITFQPSILWELQSFSSRLGFHYLQEMGGPYGVTPMSGIGISGYYHFFGLSTSHRIDPEGTVIQVSKPGPYLMASLTPVNINMNRRDSTTTSNDLFFAGFAWDIATGIGYDYPFNQNMVFSVEYLLRNGSGTSGDSSSSNSVRYSGSTLMLTFATSYH